MNPISSRYAVPLSLCAEHSPEVVGGKAHNLGRLSAVGLSAPAGWSLTVDLWRAVQEETGLGSEIGRSLSAIQDNPVQTGVILRGLRDHILTAPLPDWVETLVASISEELLAAGPVIVRSSAPHEDGEIRSQAGIYESVPGNRNTQDVLTSIRAVWASLFTERALFYNGGQLPTSMAVIVQRDIKPHVAGVMFTCDPLTGAREPIVQFERASANAVTSGRGACREIRLRDLSGVAGEEDVPPLLTDALLRSASIAERLPGGPWDIEWVWDGDRLFLLQARRITSTEAARITSTWAFEEELSRIYKLDLGKCGDRLIKELRKKIWFRLFCLRKGLCTFRTIYVVYRRSDLPAIVKDISSQLSIPYLRVSWGDRTQRVHLSKLELALAQGMDCNRLADPAYAAAEISEIVPSDMIGFSTVLGDDSIVIEAYPGGAKGTKSGRWPATVYSYGRLGLETIDRPEYDQRAFFDSETMDWVTVDCERYTIDLDEKLAERVAQVTRQFCDAFGEVRLEWYIYNQEIYIKDLTVENQPLQCVPQAATVSPGVASGYAVCLDDISEYDELAERFMISVRHLDDGVASSELVAQTHDLCQQKPIIVVAEYPSIGLASIIQYVHGFVFERCPLLCHLAIILRERGIPAIVVANARSRISTGDSLQIGPDGLSVMPSLMTGTGGRSEEGVQ